MYINGRQVIPEGRPFFSTSSPSTGEKLADCVYGNESDLDVAVAAARAAQEPWAKMGGVKRARILYSVARHIQKHARLLSVLESMDNGKPIHESRDADIPLVARHFYYYAGWAQLMETELEHYQPVGVVASVIPWNFPLLMLAWKIAPALALGNTVVLKPAHYTNLSAFLFAELLVEAGVPPGVVNIVPCNGAMGSYLCGHPGVDKIAFTGSTRVGKLLRQLTAGSGKKCSLELGGKSAVIVFEDCDIESAVEGAVRAIFFNQGQCCCAGSRLLVQESIEPRFTAALKRRMSTMRLTDSLDKCSDMGAIVDKVQYDTVMGFINGARTEGAHVWQPDIEVPAKGLYIKPTLIENVAPVSTCVAEEIFGPVLVKLVFRTTDEAIALANNNRYGLGGSVWTENISLALHVAVNIRTGSMWVNAHNLFDAAAGFGGYKESGYGREGGLEGCHEYMRPKWMSRPRPPALTEEQKQVKKWAGAIAEGPPVLQAVSSFAAPADDQQPLAQVSGAADLIDRTPKMYIGGTQKRPDANYVKTVYGADGGAIAQVGDGNRKDIRDAVEAARGAFPGWGKRAAYNRAQICYYIAENLSARFEDFALRITAQTGRSIRSARDEVTASIDRLFTYAAYADKYGGTIQETAFQGVTAQINEPVGVVAIVCPDEYPLLGFISLFAPAIIRSNCVVIVPSARHPLSAIDLYQVFDTSDLPNGVVNIVTGDRDLLAKVLAEHEDVDAIWYFGDHVGAYHIENLSVSNCKRTWTDYGIQRDWMNREQGEGQEFLHHAVQVKNIWMPYGPT
jgi:aldehyde dehydrogenase (NAD+)